MARHSPCGCLLASLGYWLALVAPADARGEPVPDGAGLFARGNLVAWCIVPFDAKRRGPEERAAMLKRLGFSRFAYDWRAEHVPTFDAELNALRKQGITLQAFWFPAQLNSDARAILAALRRHKIRTQLWVMMTDPDPKAKDDSARVEAAARVLRPVAEEAAKLGCSVGLYNHGGWFGEPEHQLLVLDRLKLPNVGLVYNLHHGHDHLARFPGLLRKMLPHLLAINLNGMVRDGERLGKKILPLGQGDADLALLKTIRESGYRGPVGILGHTQDDAEARLRDNLDGLDWLVAQLDGKAPGPRPRPRTGGVPPATGAGRGWLAAGRPEYRAPPLTVECRARLGRREGYNILVASDTKQSAAHWELFSMAGTGRLTAYLPGLRPDHVRSDADVCDGRWHHLAMQYEPRRVRLYCDGKLVADQAVEPLGKTPVPGKLAFGRLVEGGLDCDGRIDWVRLTRGVGPVQGSQGEAPPGGDTLGLWRFDGTGKQANDLSGGKNHAEAAESGTGPRSAAPPPGNHLVPADARLRAVLLDRSADDAYLAVKADGVGNLFVGGREAVFVFEPDDKGGYGPRRVLCRLPPDSIVMGLEIRGDDLYVLAAHGLYLLPGGRTKREGLRPTRLLWGLPLDLHVSFHCLAWGPEGDLYLDHGDPLLNYGDWDRPDHWGHWTLFPRPEGTRFPYTGAGGVLRLRPDGSGLRVVAGGLRGPVGLTFDRGWDLFTNDNDHESRPDRFAPARLLHVSPHADFAWPRGWMASKSPERSDLLEPMSAALGRGVPCDLAYYDEPFLGDGLRDSLLLCRWDRSAVTRHTLRPRGASFSADETPFLEGRHNLRPVGVTVGRGGRVFVTGLYLEGNVTTPHCVSDLVMVTRADDPPGHPFEAIDVAGVPAERLWGELSSPAWERRARAHGEVLRRGGSLLREASRRLEVLKEDDPAAAHLPWLAAAGGGGDAGRALARLAAHPRAALRRQAVRALAEHPGLAPPGLLAGAVADPDPRVRLAALAYFFDSVEEPPLGPVVRLACDADTYLRQLATRVLARRAAPNELRNLTGSRDAAERLAGVLAAGVRLTVPPTSEEPPRPLPLFFPEANPFFHPRLRFADREGDVYLPDVGRVGSYTTAQRWKEVGPDATGRELFGLLSGALDDPAPRVQLQAAYFLSLLRDPRTEPRLARVWRDARLREFADSPARAVPRVWAVGPFDDGPAGFGRAQPPEQGVIDLTATYVSGGGKLAWQELEGKGGHFDGGERLPARDRSSYFLLFRLHSVRRQPALLSVQDAGAARVLLNGQGVPGDRRPGAGATEFVLDLQPGSNDLLLRVQALHDAGGPGLRFRARDGVAAALPEKIDSLLLTLRLKEARGAEAVGPEFLAVDWAREVTRGDAARGRRLFGTLGCAKCHAVAADQKGGGAPGLADARKRFTVPYLVESVLLPSKQVADPFRATTLVTAKGAAHTGLVVNETPDSLEILLPDATRRTLRKADIETREVSAVSPMPAGLVKTPTELRDLLAYLLGDNPAPP